LGALRNYPGTLKRCASRSLAYVSDPTLPKILRSVIRLESLTLASEDHTSDLDWYTFTPKLRSALMDRMRSLSTLTLRLYEIGSFPIGHIRTFSHLKNLTIAEKAFETNFRMLMRIPRLRTPSSIRWTSRTIQQWAVLSVR